MVDKDISYNWANTTLKVWSNGNELLCVSLGLKYSFIESGIINF